RAARAPLFARRVTRLATFAVVDGTRQSERLRAAHTAWTSPSMVCGSASASTVMPRARTVSDVTGPIEKTRNGDATGPATASQKLLTVDDDVNVTASTSPPRTRARSPASGVTGAVRYTARMSTTYPPAVRPVGITSRAD